jgi:hypothetical protein
MHMGDVIPLSKSPMDLNSDAGHRFVVDCTRAGEGLLSDKELQEKYELSPADWANITKDMALGRAVRAERERRMLDGTAARESACRHFVKAPGVLAGIMESAASSPRYIIDAARELRSTAAVGSGADRPRETERFLIRIDLTAGGGDVTEKTITITNEEIPLEGKPDAADHWRRTEFLFAVYRRAGKGTN